MKTMQSAERTNHPDEIILRQLDKILAHPLFLYSAVLSRFLSYIVKETLAGREHLIKEYTIAVHVLNKPIGFSPHLNGVVRVHAGRLRDALKTYYNQKGLRHDCLITIPKGRYIPLVEWPPYENELSIHHEPVQIKIFVEVGGSGSADLVWSGAYDHRRTSNGPGTVDHIVSGLMSDLIRLFN